MKPQMIKHFEHVMGLIKTKKIKEAMNYITYPAKEIKGGLLEHVLAKLLEGDNWITELTSGTCQKGADILLRNKQDPQNVAIIIQAKNHKAPLTNKETVSEIIQFEQEGIEHYKCKVFQLYSMSGFVRGG